MNYEELFFQYKETELHGRYINCSGIEGLLIKLKSTNQVTIIGESVLGKPIYAYQTGTGKIKILVWSQMHGNETTATKALFDLFNLLNSDSEIGLQFLSEFTFCFVPMLNPDGADLYTRANANGIDLNRDFQLLSQPESQVLRKIADSFKPDYCYNLHDQRTIFGVESTGKPATLSFLSPAYNEKRELNETRHKAIQVIVAMNKVLQTYIPGQVGRFEDSFNINCAGDNFQSMGIPTLLFEAGHFQHDHEREQTRKYFFIALVSGFQFFHDNVIVSNEIEDYLNIPQNKVVFYDFVYKNVKINYDGNEIITNFAAQYKEELIDNQICFNAYIVEVGELKDYFGHFQYDAQGAIFQDKEDNFPKLNQKANFFLGKETEFVNGLIKM